MATLPQWTKTLDDDFVNTWYEIRAEVIDNILEATILTAALKNFGCFTPQVGSKIVTRTVGYGTKSTQRFGRGTVVTQSTPDLDTMAEWDWRYFTCDINRTLIDDATNAGKFQIKSYLSRRMEAARDACVTDMEKYLMQWGGAYDAPKQMNGLYDINTLYTAEAAASDYDGDTANVSNTQISGTANGKINKTNSWWRNWVMYSAASESIANRIAGPTNAPYALNLVPDMRHAFNSCRANAEGPNLILADQAIYEAYEDEAADKQQIVQSAFTKIAIDLGFDAFTFKGATMSYTYRLSGTKHVHMLNLNHVEVPYQPNVWFDLVGWKDTPGQFARVNYIVCMTTGLITAQPRRHLVMEYAS